MRPKRHGLRCENAILLILQPFLLSINLTRRGVPSAPPLFFHNMNSFHNYKIRRESEESQREAGRYNPASVILWTFKRRKCRLVLHAGSGDSLAVFRNGNRLVVLSTNTGLGYAGLQVADIATGEETGEVFLQADYEVEEILGRDGLGKSDNWIARALLPYAEG